MTKRRPPAARILGVEAAHPRLPQLLDVKISTRILAPFLSSAPTRRSPQAFPAARQGVSAETPDAIAWNVSAETPTAASPKQMVADEPVERLVPRSRAFTRVMGATAGCWIR
jgi:hypothetical protein